MRYLKINAQHYLRYDQVKEVATEGSEGHVRIVLNPKSFNGDDRIIWKVVKDFAEAEREIAWLVGELANNADAQMIFQYPSRQLAAERG